MGILYGSPLLSLFLPTVWVPQRGRKSKEKMQGRDKEDTKGLCYNKYNYKSQYIIMEKHKCNHKLNKTLHFQSFNTILNITNKNYKSTMT